MQGVGKLERCDRRTLTPTQKESLLGHVEDQPGNTLAENMLNVKLLHFASLSNPFLCRFLQLLLVAKLVVRALALVQCIEGEILLVPQESLLGPGAPKL